MTSTKDRRVETVCILGLMVCIGAALRYFMLDFNLLWVDEAWTLFYIRNDFLRIAVMDVHPPLWYWMEKIAVSFLGEGFIGIRLFPAIAGVLSIPAMYLLGKEFCDRNAGFIAAGLLTVSVWHIQYSQAARSYSFLVLLFIVTLYVYLKALRAEYNNWKPWAVFGVLCALLLWTHYLMVFPIVGLFIHAIYVHKNAVRRYFNTHCIKIDCNGAVMRNERGDHVRWPAPTWHLYAWMPLVVAAVSMGVWVIPIIRMPLYMFQYRATYETDWGMNGLTLILETLREPVAGYPYAAALAVLLMLLGTYWLKTGSNYPLHVIGRDLYLFAPATLLPTLIGAYWLADTMPTVPRHIIFVLPVIYLLVAASYRAMYRFHGRFICCLLLLLIFGVNIVGLGGYYGSNPFGSSDWTEFNPVIGNITQEGDMVIVMGVGWYQTVIDYYYDAESDGTTVLYPSGYDSMNASEFRALVESSPGNTLALIPWNETVDGNDNANEIYDFVQKEAEYDGNFLRSHLYYFS